MLAVTRHLLEWRPALLPRMGEIASAVVTRLQGDITNTHAR